MRRFNVKFREAFYSDLDSALLYYGSIKAELEVRFEAEVDAAIASLEIFSA